jgi:hypothetical protein
MPPNYITREQLVVNRDAIISDANGVFMDTIMGRPGWDLLLGTSIFNKVEAITFEQVTQEMVERDHFGGNSLRRLQEDGLMVQTDADTLAMVHPFMELAGPVHKVVFQNKPVGGPSTIPASAKLSVRLIPNREHNCMDATVSLKPHGRADVRDQCFIPIHFFPSRFLATNGSGAQLYLVVLGHNELLRAGYEMMEFLGLVDEEEEPDLDLDGNPVPQRRRQQHRPTFLTNEQFEVLWGLVIQFFKTLGLDWANYSKPNGELEGLVFSKSVAGDSYHISRDMLSEEVQAQMTDECMQTFMESGAFRAAQMKHPWLAIVWTRHMYIYTQHFLGKSHLTDAMVRIQLGEQARRLPRSLSITGQPSVGMEGQGTEMYEWLKKHYPNISDPDDMAAMTRLKTVLQQAGYNLQYSLPRDPACTFTIWQGAVISNPDRTRGGHPKVGMYINFLKGCFRGVLTRFKDDYNVFRVGSLGIGTDIRVSDPLGEWEELTPGEPHLWSWRTARELLANPIIERNLQWGALIGPFRCAPPQPREENRTHTLTSQLLAYNNTTGHAPRTAKTNITREELEQLWRAAYQAARYKQPQHFSRVKSLSDALVDKVTNTWNGMSRNGGGLRVEKGLSVNGDSAKDAMTWHQLQLQHIAQDMELEHLTTLFYLDLQHTLVIHPIQSILAYPAAWARTWADMLQQGVAKLPSGEEGEVQGAGKLREMVWLIGLVQGLKYSKAKAEPNVVTTAAANQAPYSNLLLQWLGGLRLQPNIAHALGWRHPGGWMAWTEMMEGQNNQQVLPGTPPRAPPPAARQVPRHPPTTPRLQPSPVASAANMPVLSATVSPPSQEHQRLSALRKATRRLSFFSQGIEGQGVQAPPSVERPSGTMQHTSPHGGGGGPPPSVRPQAPSPQPAPQHSSARRRQEPEASISPPARVVPPASPREPPRHDDPSESSAAKRARLGAARGAQPMLPPPPLPPSQGRLSATPTAKSSVAQRASSIASPAPTLSHAPSPPPPPIVQQRRFSSSRMIPLPTAVEQEVEEEGEGPSQRVGPSQPLTRAYPPAPASRKARRSEPFSLVPSQPSRPLLPSQPITQALGSQPSQGQGEPRQSGSGGDGGGGPPNSPATLELPPTQPVMLSPLPFPVLSMLKQPIQPLPQLLDIELEVSPLCCGSHHHMHAME